MEVFLGVHLVRLRCAVRSPNYLTADEDARGVRLTTNREVRSTLWTVELVPGARSDQSVLLRGDFAGYLSACSHVARSGGSPGGVAARQQLIPVGDPAPPEMRWRAARREGHFVLRNLAGGYLRANGRSLRWCTSVSVADDDGSQMLLWSLEQVPLGLQGLLIEQTLLQQAISHGIVMNLPQVTQSIGEKGLEKQSQNLVGLHKDCLIEIASKLPSRADILRFAASSRNLWRSIGSNEFNKAYYTANGASIAELIGVINRREIQIMALSVAASAHISLDGLENQFGIHIIDSNGGLLLLKDDLSGGMLIYDPTNGRRMSLYRPPVPEDCELVSAAIAPDKAGQYSEVIALYAKGHSSLFGHDTVWIATASFYPRVTKWTIFDNGIDFDIKEAEIKPPAVVAGGELHFLNYNRYIISISLDKPHRVRIQCLPFRRRMLIPSHTIWRTNQCKLGLIAREDNDLTAWEYTAYTPENKTSEATKYKCFRNFPQIPFFAVAVNNFLVVSDQLLCFNMEKGQFDLPFVIPPHELEGRHVVPYEMAWPPRPALEERPLEEENSPS